MSGELAPFVPIADAVAALLRPHGEVVVHDLRAGTIHHIAGGLSRRRPGDPSLTEVQDVASIDRPVIGPYAKTNPDGRPLKSVSAVLAGPTGAPVGLLCVNVDVSVFETLRALSREFLRFADEAAPRPSALFHGDWREEVNDIVGRLLADRGAVLPTLCARDRAAIVAALDARCLFGVRNAAPYVARLLGLSRATLYKTLRAVRAADGARAASSPPPRAPLQPPRG